MLICEVERRVDAAQHLDDFEAVQRAVAVPDRVEDLFSAVARRLVAIVRLEVGTQLSLQIAHMPGGEQLVAGADTEVQIPRRLPCKGDAKGLRDLLWVHGGVGCLRTGTG